MKRWLLTLILVLLMFVAPVSAQQSVSTTTCPGAGCVRINTQGYSAIGVQVTGTFTGTLVFEGSLDNSNWVSMDMTPHGGGSTVTSTTSTGLWTTTVAGFSSLRVRFSAYTNGSAVVTAVVSLARGGTGGTGGTTDAAELTGGPLPDSVFPATLPAISGANLTNLDASDLATGTVPNGRFPATLPAASGVNLTALNATQLTSGTVPDARFPATLPAASGANLTALNATQLTSGTVPDARFPATLPAASGVNLTALNASNLASGTVAFARGGNAFVVTGKGSNETVNNSDVLQSDDALTFSIASGEAYVVEYIISWDGATNSDIKFNMSVPANVTYILSSACLATTTAGNEGDMRVGATSSSGGNVQCGGGGVGTFLVTFLTARVISSTGSGTVALQWAQNAAQSSNTTVYGNSFLTKVRAQ